MPQVTRSTTTPLGYVISTMQTQINNMLARASAGLPVLASDVAALVSIFNQHVSHYHQASDLRGVDTYGNIGTYGAGTYVTSTSATPTGFVVGSLPPAVTVDGEISAGDINAIIAYINSIRSHTHNIDDVIS